jgi:hypothetical protein
MGSRQKQIRNEGTSSLAEITVVPQKTGQGKQGRLSIKPSPVEGSREFAPLRELLGQEPKNKKEETARFNKLLQFYSDADFSAKMQSKYLLVKEKKKDALSAKDLDESKRLSREILELEADIALYKKLWDTIDNYSHPRALSMQRKLWSDPLRGHGKIYGYTPSSIALEKRLRRGKMAEAKIAEIQEYINTSQKRSPKGTLIEMGTGPSAQKNAEGLARALRKYPQLMLNENTVRVSRRMVDGKFAWSVEVGRVGGSASGAPAMDKDGVFGMLDDKSPPKKPKAVAKPPKPKTKNVVTLVADKPKKAAKEEELSIKQGGPNQEPSKAGEQKQEEQEPEAKSESNAPAQEEKSRSISDDPIADPFEESGSPKSDIPEVETAAKPMETQVAKPEEKTVAIHWSMHEFSLSKEAIKLLNDAGVSPVSASEKYTKAKKAFDTAVIFGSRNPEEAFNSGGIEEARKEAKESLDKAKACEELSAAHLKELESVKAEFRKHAGAKDRADLRKYIRFVRKIHKQDVAGLAEAQDTVDTLNLPYLGAGERLMKKMEEDARKAEKAAKEAEEAAKEGNKTPAPKE